MSELPRTRLGRLEYFEARGTLWTTNAVAIGLTPAQVTALKAAANANRNDFSAAEVARNASKAATTSFYNSGNTMFDLGRDLIKTIKAFAETTNNPSVYALANIDPPRPRRPSPLPKPPPTSRAPSTTSASPPSRGKPPAAGPAAASSLSSSASARAKPPTPPSARPPRRASSTPTPAPPPAPSRTA